MFVEWKNSHDCGGACIARSYRVHLENMPRGRMRERERESTILLDEIVAISAAAFIMRNGRHFFPSLF